MLLQEIPGPPDTVEGRDQATTPTRGRCPTSPYFPKKGGGRQLFLPRCYCLGPVRAVPVMVVSSRHHLEVTSVCRPEQELGGRADSQEKLV